MFRSRRIITGYPRSFWFLFWGRLINATGSSMYWPFLTIYMRDRMAVSITVIGLLFALNSAAGLVTTFIAGPVVDRFGRKWVMVLSLLVAGVTLVVMSVADTLALWVVLMIISGAFGPLYQVGSDAMIADLIEPARRPDAYALLRTSHNVGVAVGPAIGGFVMAVSYALAFQIAAGAQFFFALFILFFVAETLPRREAGQPVPADGGYRQILRDRPFLAFCAAYTLTGCCATLIFLYLTLYAKESYGVPESQLGFLLTLNAGMVVTLQYLITRFTRRLPHLPVMAVGAMFYALGVGSVAWGSSFYMFLVSMAIVTLGEMIMVPTASTLTANLAPPAMRGRYMSIFGLTWGVSFGVAPVIGGFLSDNVAPVAIWYGGLVLGLTSVLGFVLLTWTLRGRRAAPAPAG
ncbi:MAG: MFS transporter [Chloroflexi bacterium]|nr:MFS transporter [Chloroflexota bacterium]MBU1747296.1 MFS transporter [Chloroflexota bacterium]